MTSPHHSPSLKPRSSLGCLTVRPLSHEPTSELQSKARSIAGSSSACFLPSFLSPRWPDSHQSLLRKQWLDSLLSQPLASFNRHLWVSALSLILPFPPPVGLSAPVFSGSAGSHEAAKPKKLSPLSPFQTQGSICPFKEGCGSLKLIRFQ